MEVRLYVMDSLQSMKLHLLHRQGQAIEDSFKYAWTFQHPAEVILDIELLPQ